MAINAGPVSDLRSSAYDMKELLAPKMRSNAGVPKMNGRDIGEIYDKYAEELEKQHDDLMDQKKEVERKKESIATLVNKTYNLKHDIADLSGKGLSSSGSSATSVNGVFASMRSKFVSGDMNSCVIDVTPDAVSEQININIQRVATADRVMASEGVADITSPLGITGNLIIEGKTYRIDGNMSLNNIKNLISTDNAGSVSAKISAIGSGVFGLSFTAKNTANPITVDISQLNFGAINPAIIPPTSNKTEAELSALVSFNGGPDLLYKNNIVSDQGGGLTFRLQEAGEVKFSIEKNTDEIVKGIISMVNSYNEILTYVRSDENKGQLSRDIDDLLKSLSSDMVSSSSKLEMNTLIDMGLKYEEGYLLFQDGWQNKVMDNPEAVRTLFDFTFSSSDPRSVIIDRPANMSAALFTGPVNVQIAQVNGVNTATATIGGQVYTMAIDPDGKTLRGQDDTPLKGFVFSHEAPIGVIAAYDIKEGIGSKMLAKMDAVFDPISGPISQAEARYNREIKKKEEQIERFDRESEKTLEKARKELADLGAKLQKTEMITSYLENMFGKNR
jgi:flagellar capping protein FliD